MPYDEQLADRVRKLLARRKGITEKKMFGGLCFLLNGNMCCGVIHDELVLRLGPEGAPQALQQPNTREMDFTGKPIKSMVYLTPAGHEKDAALRQWVTQAIDFTANLPPK
jgi:TfoX/Sxy family transcriptional regulator of competence genes